jgi:hypothetical protein
MKLELKHLTPYLPYGLNIIHTSNEIYSSSNIWEMEGLVRDNIYLKENRYPADIFSVKPILRPKSDLSKYRLPTVPDPKNSSPAVIFLDWSVEMCYYDEYVFLFENHFDVFGLISAGLAVDINTLSLTP